jgi:hypothetical protein
MSGPNFNPNMRGNYYNTNPHLQNDYPEEDYYRDEDYKGVER